MNNDLYNIWLNETKPNNVFNILKRNEPLDNDTKEKVKEFLERKNNTFRHIYNTKTYNNLTIHSNIGKLLLERYENGERPDFTIEEVIELISNCEQEVIDIIIK